MVGVRDWEARTNKAAKCDLLEVYNSSEKDKLKALNSINFSNLINAFDDEASKYSDNIIFEDDTITSKKNNIMNEIKEEEAVDGITSVESSDSDDGLIDIDEI